MNKRTKRSILGLLAAVFAASSFLLLRQFGDNRGGSDSYDSAYAIASQPAQVREADLETTAPSAPPVKTWIPVPVEEEDPVLEELASIDLSALREVNPDVVGWIRIPDTRIDYPLMQGTDNAYYLKHTWDEKKNSVGSIFLEYLCSPDLTDYNTIIYGHNMNNGSMFAGLRRYTTNTYWEAHPYVYLLTDLGVYRYDIFSAYKADVDSVTYDLQFPEEGHKEAFLKNALEKSRIETRIQPDLTDRILTLSTCSGAGYNTRWVVHGRLRMMETEVS